jgi:hypothetical protein
MDTVDFRQTSLDLQSERVRLQNRRAELEVELSEVNTRLEHINGALRHINPLAGETSEADDYGRDLSQFGITDAIRHVLASGPDEGQSASDVLKSLGERGFVLTKYSSPMASVYRILSRLVEDQKDVVKVKSEDGKAPWIYRWIGEDLDNIPF